MFGFRVFISSSIDELYNERKAVKKAFKMLAEMGLDVRSYAYETDVGADPDPIHDIWRGDLDESNVYVGLFFRKYGRHTIEEYEIARSAKLPCFVYVCDRHVSAASSGQRDPLLQEFLNQLKEDGDLAVNRFEDAHDLEPKVIRDFLSWIVKDGKKASVQLSKVREELRAAELQLTAQVSEINQLKAKAAGSPDPASALEQMRQGLDELRQEKELLEEQVQLWKSLAADLRDRIERRDAQLRQAQESDQSTQPQRNVATVEDIAANMERLLRTQLNAKITRSVTTHHIDVQARVEIADSTPYTLLLRIIDGPVTLGELRALETKVTTVSAENGLLLGVSPQPQVGLLELYSGERVNAFLLGSTIDRLEGLLASGLELLSVNTSLQSGDEAFNQGDFIRAISWYEIAVKHSSEYDHKESLLTARNRIAECYCRIPLPQLAIENATSGLALARRFGLVQHELKAQLYLCEAYAMIDWRNRWQEIRPILIGNIDYAHVLDDRLLLTEFATSLGEHSLGRDEPARAHDLILDALNVIPNSNQMFGEVLCRSYLALSDWHFRYNGADEGLRYGEMALGVALDSKRPYVTAAAQLTVAQQKLAICDLDKATELIGDALQEAQHMGWKGVAQRGEYLRSLVEHRRGNFAVAADAAQKALDLATQVMDKEAEVQALLLGGETLLRLRQSQMAYEKVSRARRLSQERNYADHFAQAEALLQAIAASGAVT